MAVLAGVNVAASTRVDLPSRSSALDSAMAWSQSISSPSAVGAGTLATKTPLSASPRSFPGVEVRVESLWDTIQVLPSSKALGMVASKQTFQVEVWNGYRSKAFFVGEVEISGLGGLELDGTIPGKLGPLGSAIFTATVPESGPASIANVATFEIGADGSIGATFGSRTFTLTGSRIVLFPFSPNWRDGVREQVEYLTTLVGPSRTGKEQRSRRRAIPRRGLSFSLLTVDPLEFQTLQGLLWRRQAGIFGVPFWPEAIQANASVVAGATTISVPSVANRLFSLAPMVMIWSGWNTCEVQTLESASGSLLTVGQVSGTYQGYPWIVPVFPGRLDDSAEIDLRTSRVGIMPVKFRCEVGLQDPAPSPPAEATVYGYRVLQAMPNWKTSPKQSISRRLSRLDNGVGPVVVEDQAGIGFGSQGFSWWMSSRAAIQELRDFFDNRAGRLVPFWVPSWREDLTLATTTASGDTAIQVKACGYAAGMFPDKARRYLVLWKADGSMLFRKVTSASAAGYIESLGLDASVGAVIPAGSPISFLTLCRMDKDDLEITWKTTEFATAEVDHVEIPREVP